MRRAVLLLAWCACAGGGAQGPGTLLDAAPLDGGIVGSKLSVDFDVQLFCGKNGPMEDIASATGDVERPDGGHVNVQPSWYTTTRLGYDCTDESSLRLCQVHLGFTPDAPGLWKASVTLLPGVGTFERDVSVQ